KLDKNFSSSQLFLSSLKYFSLALALLFSASPVTAITFTVTSTADAGNGTLRDAILKGNDSTDSSIFIDLTGITGTISLNSRLPMISNYAGSNSMAVSNKSWVIEGPTD